MLTDQELSTTDDSAPRLMPSTSTLSPRGNDFRAGFVATLPLWIAAAPFGAIYAVTALNAGLSPAQTLAMSLLVFAGSAQLTSAGLFAAGAAPFAIVLATLIINARHMLLAASLAPYMRHVPAGVKAVLAFQLTDESYAIGMRRFLTGQGSVAYQFGTNVSLYLVWLASTAAGIMLGALIPDPAAYGLNMIFPLTFIGLLVPLLRDRTSLLVVAVAAVLALGGSLALEGSWYILLAGVLASGVGALVDRKPRNISS